MESVVKQSGYNMAANSRSTPSIIKLTDFQDTQERLPYWARSTNPIVRRHLGLYWRTVPPEIEPFTTIFMVWTVVMLSGFVLPALFSLIMISFLASIMVLPFALGYYAYNLLNISIEAARHMQQEFSNDTFELLQATPMSLMQIFLGKVAAAIWRRMDDIIMIAQLAFAFSPPILFTLYAPLGSGESYGGIVPPLMALTGMLVILFRAFAEPLMIGVIAIFIGIVVPGRGRSVSAAVVLGVFYFLLMNLLSNLPSVRGLETSRDFIPPSIPLIIVTDFVLPVVFPIVIILGLLKLSVYMVTRD
jgi:hypothetical protein